jgi:CBS domain-containing protein
MDARTTGAWELSDESRGYSSGGYPSGAYSPGEYSGPRDRESVHDREVREARRRDVGPYPESRTPHHQGLPSDLRAGEGDWAQSGGYAELPHNRGGYEARYQPGEWTPGGEASVRFRMGYGDHGVRHEPARPSVESPLTVVVGDVMSDDIEPARPDEVLHDVVRLMADRQVLRVPVVERGDRFVGLVSLADVATRADYDEDPQVALEKISARRSFWSRFFGVSAG